MLAFTVTIVNRTDDLAGFQVIPRRWVVERALAWISKHRRCVCDSETLPEHAEAMVYIALIEGTRRERSNSPGDRVGGHLRRWHPGMQESGSGACGLAAGGEAAAAAREPAEHHERVDQSRVEMMRGYAETTDCRRQFLLGYFGEQLDEPCGNCDSCSAGTATGRTEEIDSPFSQETPVEHTEWGHGIVMRVEDDRLVVLFDEVGYKTLALAAVTENGLLEPLV